MNVLINTIKDTLKDVHIESGQRDEWDKVVSALNNAISDKILSHDIDYYEVDMSQSQGNKMTPNIQEKIMKKKVFSFKGQAAPTVGMVCDSLGSPVTLCENELFYWGKMKTVNGKVRAVWSRKPMTRAQMKEWDDTYRHMCK